MRSTHVDGRFCLSYGGLYAKESNLNPQFLFWLIMLILTFQLTNPIAKPAEIGFACYQFLIER